MVQHATISDLDLRSRIRRKKICFGGNRKLNIYGTLHCASGKRMKQANRVFFTSEKEAVENNFRPCGRCLKDAYKRWKNGII
jgi:methylphosphotriester-DNA--protein-cysteine methyltransferase